MLCALIASLAIGVVVAPAAAGAAEPLPVFSGSTSFPPIENSSYPEDYSWRVELGAGETLTQVSEEESVIEGPGGTREQIWARGADDDDGTPVPTTLAVSEGDVLTLTVHHREGDFVYPVTESPWILISQGPNETATPPDGGFERAERVISEANPYVPPVELDPTPSVSPCHVPKLSGLTRRAAAAKLRAAHCTIGQIHLAAGASAGKGEVVRQFRAAGTELGAGTPVAVKLGSG